MDDEDLEGLWIAAGPPPEEQDASGCLSVLLLVAVAVVVLLVLIAGPLAAEAQFSEAVKDRLGRTIGHLRPDGDRVYVQDRCFTRLGWVIQDGMNEGTYSKSGQKIAESPLPFMLLSNPGPGCPTPVPQ